MSHVCETRKFVMAILHWKHGLLYDEMDVDFDGQQVHHKDVSIYSKTLEMVKKSMNGKMNNNKLDDPMVDDSEAFENIQGKG